ncbi:MAG: porphobilinogen synthase [Candidatus Firestonebacteria bacterium]
MGFPITRLRRLRNTENLRSMFTQTQISVKNLVMPLFVKEGKNIKHPILSMPGNFQFSIDNLLKEVKEIVELDILAVILFGIPDKKDALGKGAYAKDGIVQRAISEIKNKFDKLVVIADDCLCEYTSHGHCGVVKKHGKSFVIDNDASLELIAKTAVSQAKAGADIIAPSGMMDGMVKSIRMGLDSLSFSHIPIMSYSAKFASAFYGPFRDAAESQPKFGDRKTYQMNIANSDEAMREIQFDIEEGADIIMVKPALSYLDIIRRAKDKFNIPIAAYNVSGEFAMVKAASKMGWLDENRTIIEILTSIKRAGANIIITYHAKEVAKSLSIIR